MDILIEPIADKSQVKVQIKAGAEDFAPFLEKAARQLSKKHPIKGFRPGKASVKVAADALGQEAVVNQALDKAIPQMFVEAVVAKDVEALGQPATTVTKASITEGIEFESIVDVMPEVTLGNPSKIKAEKRKATVTDDKVTEELQYLAKMRSTHLEVTRPAEKNDTVVIDFAVSVDGQIIENRESKNHPVHLGEGHFVPGFEDQLLGVTAGQEKEFEITFPEDFAQENLRNKTAKIQVKVHAVQKRVIPELNDEFAQKVGKFETLEQLRSELQKNLTTEKEQKESERLRGEILDKLVESSKFGPLPESLVNAEIDRRLYELAQMLAYQQKTLDDYLAQQKKTLAEVRESLRETAEKAVRANLAIRQIVEEQKIEADEKEVGKQIDQYLARYKNIKQAAEEVDTDELRRHVTGSLRSQKALDWLEEQVKVVHLQS